MNHMSCQIAFTKIIKSSDFFIIMIVVITDKIFIKKLLS